jgi:hypothetical protein
MLFLLFVPNFFNIDKLDGSVNAASTLTFPSNGVNNSVFLKAVKVYNNDLDNTNGILTINNGDFVMLNNAKADKDLSLAREEVRVKIYGASNVTLPTLDINAYFNGKQIKLKGKINGDEDNSSTNINQSLCEYFTCSDLEYLNESDGTITNPEGYYEFEVRFQIKDSNGTISSMYPSYSSFYHFGFYLMNESNYVGTATDASNNTYYQRPQFVNLTSKNDTNDGNDGKVDKSQDSGSLINYQYYYNYQALNELSQEGALLRGESVSSNKVQYPILNYDVEKYKLSWVRTYNDIVDTVTAKFEYTDINRVVINSITNYGKLTFTSSLTNSNIVFYLTRLTGTNKFMIFSEDFDYGGANSENYSKPLFSELGNYELQYKYQLRVGDSFITDESSNSLIKIKDDILTVFGYKAMYAKNNYGSANLSYLKDGIVSDVSFSYDRTNKTYNYDSMAIPNSTIKYSLATTNQTPVWFDYYGTLSTGSVVNYYKNNDLSQKTSYSYTKGMYFDKPGYYIINILYYLDTFAFNESATPIFTQVFRFYITNATPTLTMEICDTTTLLPTGQVLSSDGYTNKNVRIDTAKPGIFDSQVDYFYYFSSTYNRDNYDVSKATFIPYYTNISEGQTTSTGLFTDAGAYKIVVSYGSGAFITYTFTIDRDSLQSLIRTELVSIYTDPQGTPQYKRSGSNISNDDVLNSMFTVYAKEKRSGATITGTIRTISFEKQVTTQPDPYQVGSNLWVLTNYIGTYVTKSQEYNNIVYDKSSNNLSLNSRYVFSEQKIYLFTFSDEAGFTASTYVFLDRTNPNIIQTNNTDVLQTPDAFNVVSQEQKLKWGSQKVINFSSSYNNDVDTRNAKKELLDNCKNIYVENSYGFNILIPITSVKVVRSSLDIEDTTKYEYTFYPNGTDTSTNFKELVIYPKGASGSDSRFTGEGIYKLVVTDNSGNSLSYSIEMNMDRSQGYILTSNNEVSSDYYDATSTTKYNSSWKRIAVSQASSLNSVMFEWKNDISGNYKIKSLTYDYYSLNYDTSSSSYPYKSTADRTLVNLLTDATLNNGNSKYYSSLINPTPMSVKSIINGNPTYSSVLVTAPGKYIITRTYEGTENDIGNQGDTKVKTYTFYVDKNPIISTPTYTNGVASRLVGSNIKLLLGSSEKQFTEFQREATTKVKINTTFDYDTQSIIDEYAYVSLTTNLLPIQIVIPQNKYSKVSGGNASSGLATFNLYATISYYKDSKLVSTSSPINISTTGFISINNCSDEGIYVIKIHDNAVDPNDQLTPFDNFSNYFAIQVVHQAPSGKFYSSTTSIQDNTSGSLSYDVSSDGYHEFSFSTSSNDPVNQQINIKKIYRREKSSSSTSFTNYDEFTDYTPISDNDPTDFSRIKYVYRFPAFSGTGSNATTYQYKIEYTINNVTYVQISSIMDEFNAAFTDLYSSSSTKEQYVAFTFVDPIDEYYAKINPSSITVKRAKKNSDGSYTSYSTFRDFTIDERLISSTRKFYSIIISNKIEASDSTNKGTEYTYKIYMEYYGTSTDYGSYFSNTQTITIDRTPPSYNLKNIASLQTNRDMLANINHSQDYLISTSYKTQTDIYYYANKVIDNFDFAIDDKYTFTLPNSTNSAQEGKYIYYRKYDKYNENVSLSDKSKTYQCVVPGDPNYYDTGFANPRFDASNTSMWSQFSYSQDTFANIVGNAYGYYEIVEIDEANNYTVYTVLLKGSEDNNLAFTSGDGQTYLVNSTNTSVSALNSLTLNVKDIKFIDEWFKLSLSSSKSSMSVIHTPSTDDIEMVNNINKFLTLSNTDIGLSFTLTISNRFGSDEVINIRINRVTSFLPDPIVGANIDGDNYLVTFPNDTDVIFLKGLTVMSFNVATGSFDLIDSDITGQTFASMLNNKPRTCELSKGSYKFTITDNYRSYTRSIQIGINDVRTFEYSAPIIYDSNNNVITTDSVKLDLQSAIYTVNIYLNNVLQDYELSGNNNGVESYIFEPCNNSTDIDVTSGGKYTYKIDITNRITGEKVESRVFTIYNIFPSVSFKDLQDINMNSIVSLNTSLTSFTSKNIVINYGSGLEYNYIVDLIRYENNFNQSNIISSNSIGSPYRVSTAGLYELQFTNETLHNKRSLYFIIKNSDISMYQVYELSASGKKLAYPASEMLDITSYENEINNIINADDTKPEKIYPKDSSGRLMVKNYFTLYSFSIEVEGDKNIKTTFGDSAKTVYYVENNSNFTTQIVLVYGYGSYTYYDIIALTYVQPTSSILSNFSYSYTDDTGNIVTSKIQPSIVNYITLYKRPVTLLFNTYYGKLQNYISVSYYFNGKLIDTTFGTKGDNDLSTLALTTAGEYKFEFSDVAGNKQSFSSTNETALSILILSEVVYNINNDDPIYGAVYNNTVVLTVPNITRYTTGSLTLTCYKNGNEYTPVKDQNTYTFADTGIYSVKIDATVGTGNNIRTLQSSTTLFTIISPNEARFAYEFTNINGYYISKIIKGGIDITSQVKGSSAYIYSIVLSENSYGIGKYHIYVVGNQSNLLLKQQSFDFNIWINTEIPVINCSVGHGQTSTDPIVLSYNMNTIYNQIGNCKIILNDLVIDVNSETSKTSGVSSLTINEAGTYYVEIQTEAGNVVTMFKVYKKDPLNTIAIVLIVVGSLALLAGAIVFIKLRLKMKVR